MCTIKILQSKIKGIYIFCCIIFLLITISGYSQPVINSFYPISAIPGQNIIIQGTGFSTTPTVNNVYFGAVKATVVSASATMLTVTVPAGALCKPLSVSVSGITAISTLSFIPTFSTGQSMDVSSFGLSQTFTTGSYPSHTILADINLDGKPDVIALKYLPFSTNPSVIMLWRNFNTSTMGFTNDLPSPDCGNSASDMAVADFNGDNKFDIVVSNLSANNEISIFKNTSTISTTLQFANKVVYSMPDHINNIATSDIDGDGLVDIIGTTDFSGTAVVLQNKSTAGSISFTKLIPFSVGVTPGMVLLSDLNNDKKPDLVVSNDLTESFSIYANTSTPGNFSFAAPVVIQTPDLLNASDIAVGDIDNDGKNDLIFTTNDATLDNGNIWLFKNNSQSGGAINISSQGILVNVNVSGPFYCPAIGDLNGDGKVDIVVGLVKDGQAAIMENKTAAGNISFSLASYLPAFSANRIAIGDMNADSKPDILCASVLGNYLSLFRSKIGSLSITAVSPLTAGEGDTITIKGRNFTGTDEVQFGGNLAASFDIVNDTLITAIVGTGNSGVVRVLGALGADVWNGFVYNNTPSITSYTPAVGKAGDTITIKGVNFLHTTAVKFGGVAATSFTIINSTTITAVIASGENGNITVTTPSGTASAGGFAFLRKPVITGFSPATGITNDVVYIYGQNLAVPGYTPVVTFGGAVASVVSYNSNQTELQATISSLSNSGYIKVSHLGGLDSMAGFTFIPPPQITSFSPQSAHPADTIIIKGREFTGVTNVTFADSSAASFIVISDSVIKAVVSHGKTGDLKVTRASGSGIKAGFTFLPLPPPVIQSFSPQQATSGTTITLYGQYLWGVLSIKIGNTPAKFFEQVNFGTLKVVVPVMAAGQITVTTYYGTYTLSQPAFVRILPPVITNFTPISTSPGQQLTINGSGFGNNVNDIKVHFGSVKASILSLQDNKVVVIVPVSALYGPIEITANNLVVTSSQQFVPANPLIANERIYTDASFQQMVQFNGGISYDKQTIPIDLNNDGKIDFVTLGGGVVSYYLNTIMPGVLSWQNGGVIGSTVNNSLEIVDIDGNGLTDIMTYGSYYGSTAVILNVSTPDSIKFINYNNGLVPLNGLKADMNGDGKIDIVNKEQDGNLKIFLNNSVPGKVAFTDTLTNFIFDYNNKYWSLANVTDFDGDGLYDIVGYFGRGVKIFHNIGTRYVPAFDSLPLTLIITGTGNADNYYLPQRTITGDMNGDGLTDLLIGHSSYNTATFVIYKNTSIPGKISFGKYQVVNNIPIESGFSLTDFNGDGYPEVLVGNDTWTYVLQNKSTLDSIILGERNSFKGCAGNVFGADIDNDNKQDIISSSYGNLYVLRNRLGEATTANGCAGNDITLSAARPDVSYQWQIYSGNSFKDIADTGSFSGTTTGYFTIHNPSANLFKSRFRCKMYYLDYSYTETYQIEFLNNWEGTVDNDWNNPANWSCGTVPDGNTSVVIPEGQTVVLNSNGICRSLNVMPTATFIIIPGKELVITNN